MRTIGQDVSIWRSPRLTERLEVSEVPAEYHAALATVIRNTAESEGGGCSPEAVFLHGVELYEDTDKWGYTAVAEVSYPYTDHHGRTTRGCAIYGMATDGRVSCYAS